MFLINLIFLNHFPFFKFILRLLINFFHFLINVHKKKKPNETKIELKKIHNIFKCLKFVFYLSTYMIIKKLYHNIL